ncbi:TniB family NTP-binding protein [Bradyrhizobium sp. CCBAU 45394]|uniref:TniB family NTP-binding protein n=1 Tax=Bradyrhizobium sp. CCBAU 45394 TaxID=1325087 RepID=UPI002303D95D|nr:TniB family NTP-binding protein [Bradyrhizobium sp. CCBAU 45394]
MTPADRLEAVRTIRVFAPDASRYLTRLNARVRGNGPAASGNAGILLTGPAHIGKHSFIEHLAQENPPVPTDTIARRSIVVVPPIARPDPSGLTEAIELATSWRYRGERLLPGAGPAFQVNRICEANGIRVLAFDRAMYFCGKFAVAADAVPFLTGIMDKGEVLVVLIGPKTLEDRIKRTTDLSERFFFWRLAPFAYGPEWIQALHDFEAKMPFNAGSLTASTMPARLYLACWGKLPRFGKLTIEAARNRLRNRNANDMIRLEDFHHAYSELAPDERNNPFDKGHEAAVLEDDIARGPQIDASTITEIGR